MDFRKRDLDAIGIIPARLHSTRFPEKLIQKIDGKPLLIHTWENAKTSQHLRRIVIACDDPKIEEICKEYNADYIMTSPNLKSGTDRIAKAYRELEESADVVVNIQADEPFLSGEVIDELFWPFSTSLARVGTLVKRINSVDELNDPSIVKVVLETDNTALYFSRSPIPYFRDLPQDEWLKKQVYWKHIGVYAYRIEALEEFVNIPQTDLEIAENLEQLRLLQNNNKYLCVETKAELVGVDTEEDFLKVKSIIESK